MTDYIKELSADLVSKIETIGPLRGKVSYVFDESDILSQRKSGVEYPLIGVSYVHSTRIDDTGGHSGLMVNWKFRVVLFHRRTPYGGDNPIDKITATLVDIQNAIKDTLYEPTRRRWRFVAQEPVGKSDDIIIYQQIWEAVASLN